MSKEIVLTQGKVTIVDDKDFEWLSQWKWHAVKDRNTFYAGRNGPTRNGKHTSIRMHREILKPPANKETDHKDHNGLHNQRHNLRVATRAQNQHNRRKQKGTSRFKGVCWNQREAKWHAEIRVDRKLIHLGWFDSEIDAAKAYDQAARKFYGEFACTNF